MGELTQHVKLEFELGTKPDSHTFKQIENKNNRL